MKTLETKTIGHEKTDRQTIRQIQDMIRTEALRLNRETWDTLITDMQQKTHDPTEFWTGVGRLMGGRPPSAPYILDGAGNRLYDDRDKERRFRQVWKNIFSITPDENRQYDRQTERDVDEYLDRNDFRLMMYRHSDLDRLDETNYLLRPILTADILRILKKMGNRKAPGPSGITKLIMTKLPIEYIQRFALIINHTFSMGYFPVLFKNGLLTLILKPEKDPKEVVNYRPITLLEIPGKILEHIVNERLQRLYETKNLYNPNQYGFRSGRGTETALTKLNELVSINQKYRDHMNIIARDVSKAFDKVWHGGLRYKLARNP